ncbi:phosphoglucosamine mutase [bacterium]|nr:phosphoglucosamine mutase [bacterium]
MKIDKSLMISISGVRGLLDKGMNPETVSRFTAAYASGLEMGRVVVGRDSRASGSSLMFAVSSSLRFMGFDVVDLGIVATPTVEIMVEELKAKGGIIITASHNGPNWNALKFLDSNGEFLPSEEINRIKQLVESDEHLFSEPASYGKYQRNNEGDNIHIKRILKLDCLNIEKIAFSEIKAVVDCVNGAGSRIVPLLLRELGVMTVELYTDVNKPFPHVPEPTPVNLTDLARAVREEKADIGFACDPDADRLVLVDENGLVCSEELTLSLAAEFILSSKRGAVVANLSTTRLMDDIADSYQVSLHRSSVGEANVIALMKQTGAVIGGEGNGGVIYPEVHYGRDAMTGIALILQSLTNQGLSLGEKLKRMPHYNIIKEKRSYEGNFPDLVEEAKRLFKGKVNSTDGIRIDMDEGWIHLRMSNTEPVIRVIAEARSEEEAQDIIRRSDSLLVKSI